MMREAAFSPSVAESPTVSIPLWPRVEPGWKGRLNGWLTRYPEIAFGLGARRLQLRWIARAPAALPLTLHLECAGRALRLSLSGLEAIDARLVGDPFMSMPKDLRKLVVERLFGECAESLPPALSQGLRLRGIEWSEEGGASREDACPTLAFECRGSASEAVSTGVLRFADAEVLDWVLERFGALGVRNLDGRALSLRAALTLGSTRIPADELATLEVGGFVWIEDAAIEPGGLRARLALDTPDGPAAAQVFIKHRRVTLTDALHSAPVPAFAPEHDMNIDVSQLELQVDFGLGELALPVGEIERLGPGYVFELSQDVADSEVRICVAGRLLALGEIVSVGRRLGVRVTRLANPVAEPVARHVADH